MGRSAGVPAQTTLRIRRVWTMLSGPEMAHNLMMSANQYSHAEAGDDYPKARDIRRRAHLLLDCLGVPRSTAIQDKIEAFQVRLGRGMRFRRTDRILIRACRIATGVSLRKFQELGNVDPFSLSLYERGLCWRPPSTLLESPARATLSWVTQRALINLRHAMTVDKEEGQSIP